MKITEVRVKLTQDPDDRLRAFCSITLDDCFVVRDLKIIDGTTGPFIAMPSRKLSAHCTRCGNKNHLRASFCNQCGSKQPSKNEGKAKLYADIAHPINSSCRELIQRHVIKAFEEEVVRSQQPGYRSSYDEGMDYEDFEPDAPSESNGQAGRRVDTVATHQTNNRRKAGDNASRLNGSSVNGNGKPRSI